MQHLTSAKFDKKLTKKQLRKQIWKCGKLNGINTITFSPFGGNTISGSYNSLTKSMYLNTKLTKKTMLEVFFHELGHHVASIKQNKWRSYHFCSKAISRDQAFSIENNIDKIARKLWNQNVKNSVWGRYTFFYPKKLKSKLINNL